ERAIQAREDYSRAHEISKDGDEPLQQKGLFSRVVCVQTASIGEYNKVVGACDKALGPAKAADFAVAKTAADEADLSVSRADTYKIEPEP
ncbi:hypothetical protein CISIN_1g0336062mg, partial [Citrus sinensis]